MEKCRSLGYAVQVVALPECDDGLHSFDYLPLMADEDGVIDERLLIEQDYGSRSRRFSILKLTRTIFNGSITSHAVVAEDDPVWIRTTSLPAMRNLQDADSVITLQEMTALDFLRHPGTSMEC